MPNRWDTLRDVLKTEQHRAITGAAIRLLEERGVSGLSMSAVAEEAGVSRQTLYNYFSSVEEILVTYLVGELEAANEHLGGRLAGVGDPVERLRVFVEESVRRSAQRDIQVTMETTMSPEGRDQVLAALGGLQRLVRDIVNDGIDRGQFRSDLDPGITAGMVFTMVAVMAPLLHRGLDPDSLARHCFALIASGLRA